MRFFLLFLLLLAGCGALALHQGWAPPRWNPWAVPDPAEPPGLFTGMQLQRLGRDPARCLAWVEAAGMRAAPVPDRETGPGCGFQGAARMERSERVRYSAPFTATCPVLAALAMWERWTLQPAARELLGAEAETIQHYGTYACRNTRTDRGQGRNRSQHATANAIDIAAVTLADGRTVRVARDWTRTGPDGESTAEARFLHRLRDGACDSFRAVLSPDYNRAHADHLHLDLGRWGVCR